MTCAAGTRKRFAIGKIRSDAVIAGFATVPRENFLGPGPWQVLRPGSSEAAQENTAVLDPACLYDDVLIAIDPVRGLNNGQPSYLAFCLDSTTCVGVGQLAAFHSCKYRRLHAPQPLSKTAARIEPSRSPAAAANILPRFPNTISLLQRRFLSGESRD
jgi:protein-L-isoaspartate(D-aspartate) O-methyltransferase